MSVSPSARRARSAPDLHFDPHAHRLELVAVIREIEAAFARHADTANGANAAHTGETGFDLAKLNAILRRHPRQGRGFFSRSELIAGFRAFHAQERFTSDERSFIARLQMRPVRSQSGVTPITVLTKPYPCPGQCIFCPNDVRMPKSYLSDEPGCQRAHDNGFDPYLQTYNRLLALHAIGHATDKAELIVLGGTFSFYPESYQRWFVKRCLDAMNDFGAGRDERAAAQPQRFVVDAPSERVTTGGSAGSASYNRVVLRLLRASGEGSQRDFEHATLAELSAVQRDNEQAATRNVGLVLETRPDHIDEAELRRLRNLGCTKVQLGLQSLSDEILRLNKRGHDLAASRLALRRLRRAGFKLLVHFMPNLLGATPESDMRDFDRMFDDPDFRPDELKVYPCSLIESAELMKHYRDGSWRPYDHDELLAVLSHVLTRTPRYARLARVIRDISSGDIVAGNRLSNFREVAQRSLAASAREPLEIRSREIRDASFVSAELSLSVTRYASSAGEEAFLELVTPADRLLGFCRLSLPSVDGEACLAELQDCALIRELHVYGAALGLGERADTRAQHRGLGTRLLDAAAELARAAGYRELAVISAVGTREYYRKRGFHDAELYQHRVI